SEVRVLGGQLPGGRQILPGAVQLGGGAVDRCQLDVAPPRPPRAGRVGVYRRVGEFLLQPGVLGQQGGEPSVLRAHLPRAAAFFAAGLASARLAARAYFCWNLATRPSVSSTRCLPV